METSKEKERKSWKEIIIALGVIIIFFLKGLD
jgi:hypothetical protein